VLFLSEANRRAFSGEAIPAGATHFVPAFMAGTRVQTKAPSGLVEKLSASF